MGQEQQKNKIVASLEEQIMAQKKMLSETENATKRVERLMKVVESKNKEEETKALYDELTEVEKAYGEQEELNGKLTEELSSLQRKNLKLHSERKKSDQARNLEKQKNEMLSHEVAILKKKQTPLENRLSELERSYKVLQKQHLETEAKLVLCEKRNMELQHGSGGDGNNVANKAKDLLSENNTLTQKIQDMEMERKRSKEKEILLEKKQAALRNENKSLVKQNGGTSKAADTLATLLKALHCSMDQSLPRNCVIRRCGKY